MRNFLHISIIFSIFVVLSYIIGARVPNIEGIFFALEHKDTALPCHSRNSFGSPDEGLSKGRGGIPFLLPPQKLNAMLKNSSGDDVAPALEIWKDIEGYEGLYQISNIGRIKSQQRNVPHKGMGKFSVPERIRKPGDNGHGYLILPLCKNGAVKSRYVHRLVATAFIPNLERKSTVNHKNGIKADNRVENLEWATQSENSQHGFDNGLIVQNKGKDHQGSRSVRQYSLSGVFLKEFASITEAATELGITMPSIGRACVGYFKQAGNYQWRFSKHNISRVAPTGKKGNGEKPVIQFSRAGSFIREFESISDAKRITGIGLPGISGVCLGKLKTSGGFIWKFKEVQYEKV